jgi:GTP-binding protein
MFDWMKATESRMVVVATKADKLTRNHANKSLGVIKKVLSMSPEDVLIPFSSETKQGREELWEIIEKHCFLQD